MTDNKLIICVKSMNVNALLELHSLAKSHFNAKKEKQPYTYSGWRRALLVVGS